MVVRYKVYEYWFFFSYLNQSMIWTHTVSVLFDQETARLCDDGGARMCIDVTQISFAHHRWGRARCSANVRSRRWRGPGSQLPAAAPRFMNCCSHADPGGRAVLLHIGSNLLALRRNFFISGEQVRVKHNFVWEFRVHYLACSGFVWIDPRGKHSVKAPDFLYKTTVCTVNILYSKSHLTLLD